MVVFTSKLERVLLLSACSVLLVAALYWAQVVVIPLVIAVLFTFILSPLVVTLQRWHLPRWPAVLLVAILVFSLLAAILVGFYLEVTGFASELPTYRTEILEKINSVRDAQTGTWIERFLDFAKDITTNVIGDRPPPLGDTEPVPVTIQPSLLPVARSIAISMLEFVIQAALVFFLVIFMLLQREDLRNRLLRLWGNGNLTSTTKAIDDASQRISRFLLFQFLLNLAYGLVVAGGLALLDVPYPFIWGFLAAVFRYVPYIGPWIAASFPLILSVAAMPTWTTFWLVLGFFLVLELIHANVIEPMVFGRSIGVSELALLVAAAFWTWLWGPMGLILSTPMTACLVVLGRHVPALEFLALLLGDEPVLEKPVIYYQRLLAKDPDEAADLVEECLKEQPPDKVFDDVVLPALMLAKRDQERGELPAEDEVFIMEQTRDILHDIVLPKQEPQPADDAFTDSEPMVLGLPGRDEADALILEMLKDSVPAGKCRMEILSPKLLPAEVVGRIRDERPALVFVATFANQRLSRSRLLCKRLRAAFANLKILVGCWGLDKEDAAQRRKLESAGADAIAASFAEARNLLMTQCQLEPAELVRSH